jgi:hypothetical protein
MAAKPGNKNALGNQGGRSSLYKEEYADQAYKLTLLGFTDKQLATFFNVNKATINNWKKEHIEFLDSVTRGKAMADGEVAASFYKRATGYEFTEVTFEKVDNKQVLELTPNELVTTDAYKKKIVVRHLPPDAGAALNWLKNRQKDLWRDKQDLEIDFEKLSDAELDLLIERITNGKNYEIMARKQK